MTLFHHKRIPFAVITSSKAAQPLGTDVSAPYKFAAAGVPFKVSTTGVVRFDNSAAIVIPGATFTTGTFTNPTIVSALATSFTFTTSVQLPNQVAYASITAATSVSSVQPGKISHRVQVQDASGNIFYLLATSTAY